MVKEGNSSIASVAFFGPSFSLLVVPFMIVVVLTVSLSIVHFAAISFVMKPQALY